MRKLLPGLILLAFLTVSCKRSGDLKLADPGNSNTSNVKWTLMSNPMDPLFTVAKQGDNEIEYYGDKDARGIPLRLTSFVIKDKKDTFSFYVNSQGRMSSIQHSSGVRIEYVWKGDQDAGLIITGPQNLRAYKSVHFERPAKTFYGYQNSAARTQPQPIPNNVTVNVTQCGRPITRNIGDVKIQLRNVQGNQTVTELPATFDPSTNTYKGTIPIERELNLIATREICSAVSEAVSTVCNVLGEDDVQVALEAACDAIGATVALLVLKNPGPIPVILQMCEKGVKLAKAACNAHDALANLCDITLTSRVFGTSIVLQPTVLYNGSIILGAEKTTFGTNQPISLSLDLGCNAPTVTTLAVSEITETSAVSGGNVVDDGGADVTARGVVYNTTGNPTLENGLKTTNGAGTGIFISNLINLSPNIKYHVRAYATNGKGTSYGNDVSFTTSGEIQGTPGDPRFNLQFTNASGADLDLYVQTPNGSIISYSSTTGQNGGQLDLDCYCGFCPNGGNENIYWTPGTAATGTYKVWVNYYGACNSSNSPSTYTLRILKNEEIVQTYTGTLSPSNSVSPVYTYEVQ